MLRAYKTELDPTAAQVALMRAHIAGARFAHNWVLERWRELDNARAVARGCRALAGQDIAGGAAACMLEYALSALIRGDAVKVRTPRAEAGARVRYRAPRGTQIPDFSASSVDWYAQLVARKTEEPERFGWLDELSSFAVREAVLDVADGWKHFFEHLKAGRYNKAGEPRFRRRTQARYHVDQPDPIRVTDRAVLIPKIGWVRLKEHDYFPRTREDSHHFIYGGKACALGVSEKDGRWYVSLRADVPDPIPQARGSGRALRNRPVPRVPGRRIGVENGVRVLAVAYDGESSTVISEPGLRDDERINRLVRTRNLWERRMARRWREGVKARDQSAGWREARARVAHYYAQITMIRDDRTGKIVRQIVDSGAETILLREPHVAGMLDRRTAPDAGARNALAPFVHGARMGDLRARIEYKQRWAGGKVELVDKFEPITKRCSVCGVVRDTSPSYPKFQCPACGHVEDRDDANAPRNLHNYSGSSSSGAASPRSAGSKPPQGDNGRENRMARPKGKPDGTAPDCSGNRACPGAPVSDGPIDASFHAESKFEKRSDTPIGSPQFRGDTAQPEADDRDRSQTGAQHSVIVTSLPMPSETT